MCFPMIDHTSERKEVRIVGKNKLSEQKERQLIEAMCDFSIRVLAGELKHEGETAILPDIAKILMEYCTLSAWKE